MKANAGCQSSPLSSVILLSDLFYSYGYDPLIDKVLQFDLVDIIERNPSSVTPGLAFTITTYDLFDGEYSPVDSKQLMIDDFNT